MMKQSMTYRSGDYSQKVYPLDIDKYIADYDKEDRRVDEVPMPSGCIHQIFPLKDAKGQTTTFAYDKNNRLIRETRPLDQNQHTDYQYDTAGRLKTKTDAKGQTITYSYDDAGRMMQSVQTDGASNTKTINFTYDDVGNLKTYSDGTSSASYDYDNLNRKISQTVNYGTFSLTTGYSYNANGTKKTFTYPNGTAIEYSYNENNQIAGINIPDAGFVSYGNYQWVRPTSITLPGGGTREFSYDAFMRTQAITGKDPGQNTLLSYSYGFDKMGNIKTRNTQDGNFAYNYDDLYRLNEVKKDANQTESYTYDQVGNRTTSAAAAGDWTYNSNNELLSLPGLNGQSSPTTYQYDANGNTIQKNANGQIQNYVYDVNNRLIQVKDGNNNVIATYTYDPFGRRISKEVSGVKTYFLYSDEGLIGEYDSTGNEIKTYGYKPNSAWSTNPLFMKQGTNYYFYHNDHLGTPQKMTDISGAVVWSATYDAFGKATIDMAGVTNNLRFPGQYYDAETGLHYNGNRYYDANTGRYVTKDPIGFYGGDANLYRYATNDPVNEIDPMGLASRGPCGENTSGYWVGTGIGQDSAQWYADMYNKTGDWYYALGGGLSSLWTPDTWMDTLNALLIAEGASKFLAERAAAEAAAAAERSAANEQVAQVLENKAKGDAFRDEIADLMQKSGRDVQTEVVKDTPFGRRVIDIEVSQDGKVIGGIETKTGNSPYTPSQRAKDAWLGQQGYPVNVVRDR